MKNIYLCLMVALLQFSMLEALKSVPETGQFRQFPGIDPIIYRPSPTFPNPRPEIRFRRDVEDLAEESKPLDRPERSVQPKSREDPIKPHILINRPPIPTFPDHEIRYRRATLEQSKPKIGIIRPLPGKDTLIYRPSPTLPRVRPDILIYRPTPTFPVNPKPDMRFRREVDDDFVEENEDDQSRDKRQVDDVRGSRIKPVGADDLTFRPKPAILLPKLDTKIRRDVEQENAEVNTEDIDDDLYREKRSFAPGGGSFPNPGSSQQGSRGTWGVSVNKDKGRGPQVRTEGQGNIYTSPKGNVRVDGHGHHEFGKGRKPDYGGGVKVQGRWRRETIDDPEEDLNEEISEIDTSRTKRFAPGGQSFPGARGGQQQDRGSWGVSVNKDKGRGPQVHTEGRGNIYTSPNGNVRVDGHGHHEFGKGRKPDYGGGITVHGKWKREAEDLAETDDESDSERVRREANPKEDRGSVSVNVDRGPTGHPQIRTDANYNIYTSPNGNWNVNGNGYHQAGHGQKPSYGAGVTLTGRFRREAEDDDASEDVHERERREANPQKDRGSVSVSVDKGPRGPQVRTDANYNMYRSRNGNWEVNGNAYHQAGRHQKPTYGAGVTVTGRFRRDAEEVEEEIRAKREANPQKDPKGSVNVSINKDKGRGPQIRTEVDRNIYTSRDKSFRIHGSGYHEAGRGRKPDYGGRVTLSKSF